MLIILGVFVYVRMLRRALQDPQVVTLATATAIVLVAGMVFYRVAEGWSLLNSLYFSVSTLSTIGFGDFVPTTAASKVFTMVYIFTGVGLIGSFVTTVVQRSRLWQQAEEKGRQNEGEP